MSDKNDAPFSDYMKHVGGPALASIFATTAAVVTGSMAISTIACGVALIWAAYGLYKIAKPDPSSMYVVAPLALLSFGVPAICAGVMAVMGPVGAGVAWTVANYFIAAIGGTFGVTGAIYGAHEANASRRKARRNLVAALE